MINRYPIKAKNSTVCGYPGRDFDWSQADWKGETKHMGRQAPKPWVDGNATDYYQYIHVPWNWEEDGTIFRVRPSSFEVGKVRYGRTITSVKAVEDNGQWFWEVEYSSPLV